MRNLTLKTKFVILVATFVAGLGAYCAVAQHALQTARVGGPAYNEITALKDVIADVLPPPLYIVESYLAAYQLVGEEDAAKRDVLIQRGRVLRKEYEARREHWLKELGGGHLKDLLTEQAYRPAAAFFEMGDGELIPAVQRGDLVAARE